MFKVGSRVTVIDQTSRDHGLSGVVQYCGITKCTVELTDKYGRKWSDIFEIKALREEDDENPYKYARFRVGERVVIIGKDRENKGSTGMVTSVDENIFFVQIDGDKTDTWYTEKELLESD